jgi:hypothetical protein
MATRDPKKKTPGVLLPGERPLRSREVVEGLYVVEDNPYTDRYDFFESSQLYQPGPDESLDLSELKRLPDREP